jgi:type IV pilus biogenesis protein CpaD/CtpE
MPGLVPGIHVFDSLRENSWMAGTTPGHDKLGMAQLTNALCNQAQQSIRIAGDRDLLQPRLAAMRDADRGRRHAEPVGNQRLQRRIGAASLGDRANARFQHALAAMILDPDDLIARRPGREPHGKDHAVAVLAQRKDERLVCRQR